MVILQHASHSELVLNALEDSPYKSSLQRITQLNPIFINQLGSLALPDLMNLLKLSAHPNFFALLEKFPAETTLVQLQQWLEATPEKLPVETEEALNELRHYQTNHERLAEENKHNLLKLRQTYHLTLDKFKLGLEKLKPRFKEKPPAPVQEIKVDPPTFHAALYIGFKYTAVLTIAATSIIYSALYLSAIATFGCFIIAGWLTFPYFKDLFSTSQQPTLPLEASKLEEILFLSFEENPLTADLPTPSAGLIPNEIVSKEEQGSAGEAQVSAGETLASIVDSNGLQTLVETTTLVKTHPRKELSAGTSTPLAVWIPDGIPEKEERVATSEKHPPIGNLKCSFFNPFQNLAMSPISSENAPPIPVVP